MSLLLRRFSDAGLTSPSANQNLTHQICTATERQLFFEVPCNEAVPYPTDGLAREWWGRLKTAFGTASSAFVGTSLQQLIAAARLPDSGISETAVNASLAFIEGAKPRDEIDFALVMQMA